MGFPLLAKDLAERAARRRTYLFRALFGFGLMAWFWWFMRGLEPNFSRSAEMSGFQLMGAGREIFSQVSLGLCWALLVVQPALMASALTHEKERGTLELLLLTPMRPWKLLLEKYFAGLVPMATLLLFALPLGAVAYAYGGVSPEMLLSVGLVLFCTWLQAGAAALFCSAWSRTTPTAILASYALLAGFYFAGEVALERYEAKHFADFLRSPASDRQISPAGVFATGEIRRINWLPTACFPVRLVQRITEGNLTGMEERLPLYAPTNGMIAGQNRLPFWRSPVIIFAYRNGAWILGFALLFLALARLLLLRHANRPASRFWPRLFAGMDATFHRVNLRMGGFAMGRDRTRFLSDQPILWRESVTGVLSSPRHLIRIGLGITILCAGVVLPGFAPPETVLHACVIVCGLIVLVRSVEASAGERHRQTLDVLLATPMRADDIIRQKARAPLHLSLALVLPIAFTLLAAYRYVVPAHSLDEDAFDSYFVWVFSGIILASLLVCFWEIRWLGIWCGLFIRSRAKATLTAMFLLLAWVQAPRVMEKFIHSDSSFYEDVWFRLFTPDGLMSMAERGEVSKIALHEGYPKFPGTVLFYAAGVLACHASAALLLRMCCMLGAEKRLRRR